MAVDKLVDSTQLDSDLNSVANAILDKSGGTGPIAFPSGFVSEIQAIATGDANPIAEDNDVIFIDYDGTIRYSYTVSDFMSLSSLPANPSHNGLTAQGWNWTLADAKTYVSAYGKLVIGQNYITSDGITKFYMTITPESQWAEVRLKPSVSNGVTIDWGDESTTTTNSTSTKTYHHDYSSEGEYIIKISVNSNVTVQFWGENPWQAMTGSVYVDDRVRNRQKLHKVEFGSGIASLGSCIGKCQDALETITIPTSLTTITGTSIFSGCYSLKAVVFPKDAAFDDTNNASGDFNTCYAISYISMPKGIIDTAKTLRKTMFQYCYNLKKFNIPTNVVTIGESCFYGVYLMRKIVVPAGVTTINASAFGGVYPAEVHMLPTTPPALANKNAFNSLLSTAVIYVPYSADHSILNSYQTASNWVDWASYMQEEPQ